MLKQYLANQGNRQRKFSLGLIYIVSLRLLIIIISLIDLIFKFSSNKNLPSLYHNTQMKSIVFKINTKGEKMRPVSFRNGNVKSLKLVKVLQMYPHVWKVYLNVFLNYIGPSKCSPNRIVRLLLILLSHIRLIIINSLWLSEFSITRIKHFIFIKVTYQVWQILQRVTLYQRHLST